MAAGRLFVLATPLGNLEDLTPRVARLLGECAFVLAEDTRVTSHLCSHLNLRTPLVSCHGDNEAHRVERVLQALEAGQDVAYCSDAGTPAVSDPGARIVAAVHDAGYPVIPVAGPSAVTTALSASGFEGGRFLFAGFLPRKGQARAEAIASLEALPYPAVLFESPERLPATLADLVAALGGARVAVVARELTKRHEEIVRASLEGLAARFAGDVRGEVVLVLGPHEAAAPVHVDDAMIAAALRARPDAERLRDRVDAVAAQLNVPRRRVYQLAVGATP